ncbi:hypothetical protein UNDYM_4012 [Undibacterium sp. YM2]|uniref:hypothetical protein n=1 Tax=Undibacterium sp. YM2 TaxID=2058625 RepID=UPI001331FC53|nr:hypothetical protein [Undibacterium sp. YM2]BBB68265.1 hypothetical protein UNDYM_4012 [Undibacterium sp. YM2]
MFCSTSVTVHLLRGLGALTLVIAAFLLEPFGMIWSGLALIAAFLLMRGCPMCWMMGLIEALYERRKKKLS